MVTNVSPLCASVSPTVEREGVNRILIEGSESWEGLDRSRALLVSTPIWASFHLRPGGLGACDVKKALSVFVTDGKPEENSPGTHGALLKDRVRCPRNPDFVPKMISTHCQSKLSVENQIWKAALPFHIPLPELELCWKSDFSWCLTRRGLKARKGANAFLLLSAGRCCSGHRLSLGWS